MTLKELKPNATRITRKRRVGRGDGSGRGNYSGRGMKGQSSRSGGRRRPGFEGGQTPLIRRMPKIGGFTNPNRVEFQPVNVEKLNIFNDKDTVDVNALYEKGLVSKKTQPVKILGNGSLEKALTVKVDRVSKSAAEKIAKAKGTVEELKKAKAAPAKKEEAATEEKES